MTGFDIALSLFLIAGALFYGRWAYNRDQTMTDEEFQRKLRDRSYE